MSAVPFPPEGISPRIGERIQICRGPSCFDATLIGCIKGITLLATAPMRKGQRIDFLEGEAVELRMFSGKDIYRFSTQVERVCIAPVHYLHLGYPKGMKVQPLRRSPWVRLKLPALAQIGGNRVYPVLMNNLSAEGAQFETVASLGEIGGKIRVAFEAEIDGMERKLTLDARIEHQGEAEEGMREYGISFSGPTQEDLLWLKCLVYKGIAEGFLI